MTCQDLNFRFILKFRKKNSLNISGVYTSSCFKLINIIPKSTYMKFTVEECSLGVVRFLVEEVSGDGGMV